MNHVIYSFLSVTDLHLNLWTFVFEIIYNLIMPDSIKIMTTASIEKISDKHLRVMNGIPALRQNDQTMNSSSINILISEGGAAFYDYVKKLGLTNEADLVVLSSQHHYYYDPEEIKRLTTLISLQELNQVKNVKQFINSCLQFLPDKSHFIGCFTDNEKTNGYEIRNRSAFYDDISKNSIENGIASASPFINMIYSLMDSKICRYLSKAVVSGLLYEHGFRVKNMTDIDGLTLFHSQKTIASVN